MWTRQWTEAHPQHLDGLRLYYAALVEEGNTDDAIDVLRKLVQLDPQAPERLELVKHLAKHQAFDEALDLLASAPSRNLSMALLAHELTLVVNGDGQNIETKWLQEAEAIEPGAHQVILARYKLKPTLEHAVEAISKLKARPQFATEFETVQAALRILAGHAELKPDSWLALLQDLEDYVQGSHALELALIWETFGSDEKAQRHFESVLQRDPIHELAALRLSRLHLRHQEAEAAFKVLTSLPTQTLFASFDLAKTLAEAAMQLRRYEIAHAAQQVVVKHRPNEPYEKLRLAQLCNFNGLYEDELKLYDECISNLETRLAGTLLRTFSTPRIYQSEEQLEQVRERILGHLPDFKATATEYTDDRSEELHAALVDHTNFSIGYQQCNDIEIQRSFGEVLHAVNSRLFPDIPRQISRKPKPQIAFYSHFTWSHTVGKLFHRWMTGLSDLGFDVAVVSNSPTEDRITQKIKNAVSTFEVVSPTLEASVQTLRALSPDILIFPELGMGPLALGSAATRSAPIQCMAWGHPITSGLPTVDYFLSSALMEPENGQSHYTEKLIKLPGLSIEFDAPQLPTKPYSRTELGLPEDRVLLLSCQTLYKLLPRYDEAYIEVLKASPEADLVFIANPSRYITAQFQARLHGMMEKNGIATTRLHLVGPFPHDAYLSLNLACDVFLDAHGWSGGNTTLEALRTNLPIVTTPGEFMRGRHSTAILEQLGLKHFIADNQDDWTKKAIQYAKDESLRVAHAAQISDASQLAYRDPKTVEALGREMTKLYQDL